MAALAAWLVAALAATGGRAGDWMPLLPDQDFYDFQLFAPPDLQEYSLYRRSEEGLFFNYDRLYWSVTRPRIVPVGRGNDPVTGEVRSLVPTQPISPSTVVSLNNQLAALGITNGGLITFGSDELQLELNTSWMNAAMSWGNRYEFGWIYDDYGVKLDYFSSGEQNQDFSTFNQFAVNSPFLQLQTNVAVAATTVAIAFIQNATSPPPDHVITQTFTQSNRTEIQSAAAVIMARRDLLRRGSGADATFSVGPRFLQLDDRFGLTYASTTAPFNPGTTPPPASVTQTSGAGGTFNPGTSGAAGGGTATSGTAVTNANGAPVGGDVVGNGRRFQDAAWDTHTLNNMVGPEFGLRLENGWGRWSFSTDLKFTPAFNWQNNIYRGANMPATLAADYLRTTFQFSQAATTAGGGPVPPPPLLVQIFGLEQQNATNQADYKFVFCPIGEWRLGAEYKVSQAISLNAGYTGMWLGSVARAASNTGYNTVRRPVSFAAPPGTPDNPDTVWKVVTKEVPYNRIGPASGGQEFVFVNGINFGVNINY